MKMSAEISLDENGDLEQIVRIYFDQAALKQLISDLQTLKKPGDHLHNMSESWGGIGIELSEKSYDPGNKNAHHLEFVLTENEK